MSNFCPVCDEKLIRSSGPVFSEILIVGNYPTDKELLRLRPSERKDVEIFPGWSGKYFRQELAKAGLDYQQCRAVSFWQHKQNKNNECLNFMMEQVIQEAQDKKLILLCGADVVNTFLEYKVSETCGLWMESKYFTCKMVMPIPSISGFLHGGIGELVLAFKKFVMEVEKLE